MPKPFTFRIFVPQGNPEGLRIFDEMNWAGKGLIFPRKQWNSIRNRDEFDQIGVYILYGFGNNQNIENEDLATVYIGQGDSIGNRINAHYQNKEFWDSCIVFVSTSDDLNRAHITWLEYALIQKALETKRSKLYNASLPNEPKLNEAEKADTVNFLDKIYQILLLAGIHVFNTPHPITRQSTDLVVEPAISSAKDLDTVIVPARKETFESIFLAKNCWYQIRIGGGMLTKIKYLAIYQTHPISAITHYAPVERIVPFGDQGKYQLDFSESPKELNPSVSGGPAVQGPKYTSFKKLKNAKSLSDL
ncbi:MAG: GIY-YIG nuclease family protein [Rhodobacteraceae bacterium]|nr:GIY-YIG nuclease family protein [Paracoccaceae bacterium]